jgi:hypothetical protein
MGTRQYRGSRASGPHEPPSGARHRGLFHWLDTGAHARSTRLCYQKVVGQGGKATLATAPDADILREIVCLLKQRVRAGGATFLTTVKSHRGERINERADTLERRDGKFLMTTRDGTT